MKKTGKILSAALAAVIVTGAAGCGGGGGRTADNTSAAGGEAATPAETTAALPVTEDPNKDIDVLPDYNQRADIVTSDTQNVLGA